MERRGLDFGADRPSSGQSWSAPRAWERHGLVCPAGNRLHQPHPDPWWSGESVFASEGRECGQPCGPFFHVVYDPATPDFSVGDYLTPPAVRRLLTPRMSALLREDGCIEFINYDVHAVYVTTGDYVFGEDSGGYAVYEVESEGRLWPDPELPVGLDSWCASQARIVSVLRTRESSPDPADERSNR